MFVKVEMKFVSVSKVNKLRTVLKHRSRALYFCLFLFTS